MHIESRRLARPAALVLLLWSCGVAAAPSLDLPTAIRLALAQPALRAAAHEAAAADSAVAAAGAWPNPTVEYLREGRAGTRTSTVQVNQPIELGGKRQARIGLALEGAAQARAELALRRQALRAEVVSAYHAMRIARERQVLGAALVALAHSSVALAGKRVAAGKSAPLDETRARLALADAVAAQAEADGQLDLAATRLGALVGKPAQELVLAELASTELPELAPLAELLAALDEGAALGPARGQLASSRAQATLERAARVPDLTLSVGSQREAGAAGRQAVVGLSMALPLFDRNSARLGAALRRADGARDGLDAARASLGAELADARIRYEVARSAAGSLRNEVLPSARAAHALTLKGFEHGKFAMLDVLDAQRTLLQSQTRLCDTLLDAWRAYADVERLAGSAAATSTSAAPTQQEPTP